MSQIEVRRLRYRGEASQAARAEFAVGDALRTEIPDDGRLILVRSLRLGRIGPSERSAAQAAASAWRDVLGTARHGGSSGAETANCVWFNSAAEARLLLLRELARGRTPFAWFWALAVPDWRRMALSQYLEHRLAAALAESSDRAVAELVKEAIAAECSEALGAVLVAGIPGGVSRASPAGGGTPRAFKGERPLERPDSAPAADETDDRDLATALTVVRALPAALAGALARVAAHSGFAAFVETLVRALVLRSHPALNLSPPRLATTVAAAIRVLQSGKRGDADPVGGTSPKHRGTGAPMPGVGRQKRPSTNAEVDLRTRGAVAPHPAPADPGFRVEPRGKTETRVEDEPGELASHAAGLFLVIVPLIRLGWREWLAAHPEMLLHQPGARLLRSIATRHRVPATDAVWSLLSEPEHDNEPSAEVTAAFDLWRRGLNGWLRRKAGVRLAELVRRRGWLRPGPEITVIRFPLSEIDIRLRRLALDADPGWVDWLGHSYRLVYRDRPLIGAPFA